MVPVLLAAVLGGTIMTGGLLSVYTKGFAAVNQNSDFLWLKRVVAPSVKGVCEQGGKDQVPQNSNLTNQLEGIADIRIKQKNTLGGFGDKIRFLQVRFEGGKKKGIRLDTNGLISDGWTCSNNIKINTTVSGTVPHGNWVATPEDKVQKFRILEKSEDKVRIQVRQN
ncbi:MAG: hypothetical protein ABEJ36_04195 [Candidatus Nanosalina sp.]